MRVACRLFSAQEFCDLKKRDDIFVQPEENYEEVSQYHAWEYDRGFS
jgi:hypothetical protein